MKLLKKRRNFSKALHSHFEDPISGLANLLDIYLVFIVSLILALISVYHLNDFFNEKTEITISKKSADGKIEIITKKGKEIKAFKVTDSIGKGEGEKLGTAYKLKNGKMVYIPDN